MDLPIFETERLTIRPLSLEQDSSALFSMFNDPETMRFMPSLPHETVALTRQELIRETGQAGAMHWTICLKTSSEPVGLINYLGETAIPGLAYILRREHWNQGLITEACRAVLDYGFKEAGFDRVELWINQTNYASQKVAHKLGFRLKGQIAQKYVHETAHHKMLVFGQWGFEWLETAVPVREARFFRSQPVLMVQNVAETAVFYRDQLGFNIDFLYGVPPTHGAVSRSDWTGSGVVIQLSQVPSEQPLHPAGYIYIFVDTHLDDLFNLYHQRGVTTLSEPTSYPYGMREFAIKDNNGQILRFGTHS